MIQLRKKAIYKSITYRAISIVQSLVLGYIYLGSISEAGEFALVSAVVGTVIYYYHEEFYRYLRKKGKL